MNLSIETRFLNKKWENENDTEEHFKKIFCIIFDDLRKPNFYKKCDLLSNIPSKIE